MPLDKAKKNRATSHRFLLLQQIKVMHSHPRADQLYRLVKKQLPTMSWATIYRNLVWLEEHGHISVLRYNASYSRYESRTDPHYHFICQKCDSVMEISMDEMTEFNQQISRRHGVQVNDHQLYFFGVCESCLKK